MKLGIIGAMDYEMTLLLENMTSVATLQKNNLTFHQANMNGKEVVAVISGIGKVNAALCAQMLISEFGVTHIINSGVAGAIHSDLDVGDMVISSDVLEHDMDATGFGYQFGEIPRMTEWVFKADETLKQLALKASKQTLKNHKTFEGRIVSGDQFVASPERKNFIETTFSAYATEMEGAAIGHVCHVNQIPFVIMRAMSDKADGSAHVNFDAFSREAANHSCQILLDMIEAIEWK